MRFKKCKEQNTIIQDQRSANINFDAKSVFCAVQTTILSLGLLFKTGQKFVPLHRQQLFLLVVTVLAGRNNIALGAATATRNRHNMIHRQYTGRCFTTTVMTNTLGKAPFPPLALPQLAGLVALPPDLGFIQVVGIGLDRHLPLRRVLSDVQPG